MSFRLITALMLLGASPVTAETAPIASPAIADPAPDAAHPASMEAFVIPARDGAMNAVLYLASGAAPHPTLLLLHGFPGNEQNLDLAQAARRAGWNVLTLHYRGSWGSPGAFSFSHAAEDAHTALAFLEDPAKTLKYRIDPARIAVAGHSMGGFMAADVAADDPAVIGLFLLDAWDISATGRQLDTSEGMARWNNESAEDVLPLAGTSTKALGTEIAAKADRFDLKRRIAAYGNRPIAIYGATRGNGEANTAYRQAAIAAGNTHITGAIWPTDHPFSDKRVALAEALVAWLRLIDAAH